MNRDMYINKKGEKVCNCPAYPFVHRLDSGKCKELYNNTPPEEDYRVQIVRDFDRIESRSINRSR
jgi:hypothetical protein